MCSYCYNLFKVVPEVASRLANSALMQLRSLPPILRLHKATFLAENQVNALDYLVYSLTFNNCLITR